MTKNRPKNDEKMQKNAKKRENFVKNRHFSVQNHNDQISLNDRIVNETQNIDIQKSPFLPF